jgi:hypothetical protein
MKVIKARTLVPLIAFTLILVRALFFLVFYSPKDEKVIWAQNLKTEDVVKIEAVQMPSSEHERYKNYNASEFAGIIEIINGARGKRVDYPQLIAGGGTTFYITVKDGTRHKFANNGNIYLVIDDVSFDTGYDWLESWRNVSMNDRKPDDFEY